MLTRTFWFSGSMLTVLGLIGPLFGQDLGPQLPTLPQVDVRPQEPSEIELFERESPFGSDDDGWGFFPPFADRGVLPFDRGRRVSRSLLDDPVFRSLVDRRELAERAPVEMFEALQHEVGVIMQRTQRGAAAPGRAVTWAVAC